MVALEHKEADNSAQEKILEELVILVSSMGIQHPIEFLLSAAEKSIALSNSGVSLLSLAIERFKSDGVEFDPRVKTAACPYQSRLLKIAVGP